VTTVGSTRVAGKADAVEIFDRYEEVLAQSLAELEASAIPSAGETTAGERAAKIGDILYRLSIEYGFEFNTFREACIAAFAGPAPILIGRKSGPPVPFAQAVAKDHPLLLLAFEMMPPDQPVED
jgi:hypothetical protein